MSAKNLPLLPTSGIQDPQVRNYLARLSEAWDDLHNGKDKVITSSQFGKMAGDVISQALSPGVVGGAGGPDMTVGKAIDNLTESIRNSILYQILSQVQVPDIEDLRQKIGAAQAYAGAGIAAEQVTRFSQDSALASAINRIWAYVGGSTAVIEDGALASATPSTAVATKWNNVISAVTDPNTGLVSTAAILTETRTYASSNDSTLNAIYSVRAVVASGGATVAGGFGFAATSGAGSSQGPTIDFGVLANKFYIAAPASGYNPNTEWNTNLSFPFIVVTTPTSIDGHTYAAGVYMKKAFIGDASIDQAKIGNLQVTTIKIDDNAVTIPLFGEDFSTYSGNSTYQSILMANHFAPYNGDVSITATAIQGFGAGAAPWGFAIYVDGYGTIFDTGVLGANIQVLITATVGLFMTGGTSRGIYIRWYGDPSMVLGYKTMTVLGVMK